MALRIDSSQNRNLYVGTGTEVAVSDGNAIITGNVGIGTTTPGTKLDVVGSGLFTGNVTVGSGLGAVDTDGILVINSGSGGGGEAYLNLTRGGTSGFILNHAISNIQVRGLTNIPMYFWTNNVIRQTIAADGKVGIGTTSPSKKLEVVDSTNAQLQVSGYSVETTAANAANGTIFIGNNASYRGVIDYNASSTSDLILSNTYNNAAYGIRFKVATSDAGGTTAMRIIGNGNVGIGTTSPSQKLHVHSTSGDGFIRVSGDNILDSGGEIKGFNNGFAFNVAPNGGGTYVERMRINGSGNVGIATTSPGYKLDVNDTARVRGELRIGANINAYQSDASIWVPNVGQAFTVKANTGNVGIGTTSPGAKLEVIDTSNPGATAGSVIIEGRRDGSANLLALRARDASAPSSALPNGQGGVIRFQGFDGTDFENMAFIQVAADGQAVANGDAPSFMAFGTSSNGSSNPTERMRISSNGNVTIGNTASVQPLTVAGNVLFRTTTVDGFENRFQFIVGGSGDAGNFYVYNDSETATVRLNGNGNSYINSGNVGIGTTGPQQKLHIVSTDGANIILNSNTGAENNGVFMTEGAVATPYVNGAYVYYDSTNNEFKINTGAASLSTRFTITRDTGAIKFNSYNGTNQTGSPTHILGTDANGLVVKSTAGSSIGPWLPLAAGPGDPLTNSLYISSSGANGLILKQDTSAGSNSGRLFFQTDTATEGVCIMNANGRLDFRTSSDPINTSGNTKMVLTNAGNVGIGTTGPDTKLHLEGIFKIVESGNTAFYAANYVRLFGDQNYGFRNTGGTYVANISMSGNSYFNGGNVGIGTSSPTNDGATATTLEVRGKSGTGGGVVRVSNAGNTAAARFFAGSASATIATVTNHDLNISTNNSLKMVVKAGGNVGIGITNVGQKLEVAGNIKAHDGYIRSEDGASGDFMQMFNDGAGTGNSFITTSANNLVLTPQTGILQIKGENSGSGNNASLEIFNALNAAVKINLNSNGDSYLNGGDVGIGTSSPAAKLDVAGVIFAADGNKALPGYSFASDPDTGMIRDSANVLTFVVGADRRMSISTTTVTSSLPLGIGTTGVTSGVQLQVQGNVLFGSSGVGDFYLGNYATSNHFRFHTNNSNTFFDMNCGDIYWRQGSSTRYTFFPSTANMTVNGTITQLSDIRNKENIVEIGDCINKVQAMRGVYYNRTDINTEVTKVGVIAQEVENVLPELIIESPEDGLKSVAYSELTAVLINAIKEQQEIIEDLKTRITKLEN